MANKAGQGRKPLPTSLKLLKGTAQKCRINENEPKYEVDQIQCPKELTDVEKECWNEYVPMMVRSGVVKNSDQIALRMLCQKYAEWVDATESLRKFGLLITNKKTGIPMQSPYFRIASTAYGQLQSMLSEFGLTPSSRTRVSADKGPQAKGKNAFGDLGKK